MSSDQSRETKTPILETHFQMNFEKLSKKLAYRAGTQWDAEDALMDAYERAWKYLDSFDENKSTFNQWMNRIIINAIKDHIFKRDKDHIDEEFNEEETEGVPCEHYSDKIAEEIKASIDNQKPHISEILNLHFNLGYRAVDISKLVESTHYAVNQIIYRFRTELKERYQDGGSLSA